jgi:hypothetical protein
MQQGERGLPRLIFSNAFTVFCDDVYGGTIKDRGGRWTVEVND